MKKFWAIIITLGVVLAGLAYFLQKREQRKSLEKDLTDSNNDGGDIDFKTASRQKYTSLSANKEDFIDAAKNTLQTAKEMIPPAKGMASDIKDIIADKASDAGVIAKDYYQDAKEKVEEVIENTREKIENKKAEKAAEAAQIQENAEAIELNIIEETEKA